MTAVLLLPLSCARSLGALGRVSPLTVGGWMYIFGVIWLCDGDHSGLTFESPCKRGPPNIGYHYGGC